jgi:hypothetical protein
MPRRYETFNRLSRTFSERQVLFSESEIVFSVLSRKKMVVLPALNTENSFYIINNVYLCRHKQIIAISLISKRYPEDEEKSVEDEAIPVIAGNGIVGSMYGQRRQRW